jgi:hypothetical protein
MLRKSQEEPTLSKLPEPMLNSHYSTEELDPPKSHSESCSKPEDQIYSRLKYIINLILIK